jgi:WD40 repeat protein
MGRIPVVWMLAVGLAVGTGPVVANGFTPTKANQSPRRVSAVRTDRFGDPLPEGAVARLGTVRWRLDGDLADAMAVSRDGKTLVTANARSGVTVWDMATGRILRRVPDKEDQGRRWLGNDKMVALSSDAGTAVFVNKEKMLSIVDVRKGQQRRQWELASPAERMVISADGGIVATRGSEGLIQVWDARSGKEMYRVMSSPKENDSEHGAWLALSGDGKTLAFVGDDKEWPIHVHDVGKGKECRCIKGHDGGSRQVVLSADGSRLISLSGSGVQLWGLKRGRLLHQWGGEKGHFPPMAALSPDGNQVVLTRDFDGPRLLDLRSGKAIWAVKRFFRASCN